MIRIANRQRQRFEINSDSDDEELIELFNDNEELIELSSDNEVKIDDEDKDKIKKKAEVEKNQILAASRPLRNTALPMRYRDSQIRPSAKSNIQKFEIER